MELSSAKPEIPAAVSDLEGYSRSAGFDRLGWTAPAERLTLDQWDAIADYAHGLEKMVPFAIGDIVIYAQSQGKEYEDQAMQRLNIKPQTGYNCAVISRLFPRTLRWLDGNMTAQHHKNIAKLARKDMDKAQHWLEQAKINDWSARQVVKIGFTKNGGSWCYILDFLNKAGDLAVECDGGIHKRQRGRDRRRDTRLGTIGIRTLRVTNKDVLKDIDGVLAKIRAALESRTD